MQPYLLSSRKRLRHWKTFRCSLDETLTDEEHLFTTMKYWQQYPLIDRYIDSYAPELWPTPWELLYENQFCRSSLAYMMEQTLLKSDDGRWKLDRLSLKYIDDKRLSDEFIILVVDNKYVINYDINQVIKFDKLIKMCHIKHEYLISNNIHIIV